MIPEPTIRKILDAVNIVEVIGAVVPLKRSGSGHTGNCPFHAERTPSFHVSPEKGLAYCFGCGWGGNAISFVMEYGAVSFPEACQDLGARYGIEVESEETPEERRDRHERERREFVLDEIQKLFKSGEEEAIAYLAKRGFQPDDSAGWGVGVGPTRGPRHLVGFRETDDDTKGALRRFKQRLTFPITTAQGRLVGWSGRALADQKAKYVNSPNGRFFDKGKLLFGLQKSLRRILRDGYAILCEGQLDVIAMHAIGHGQAIAALGTGFSADHAAILKRYTSTVILAYDSDDAGRKASKRTFQVLAGHGIHVKALTLPPGKDPADLFREDPQCLNPATAAPYLQLLASSLPQDPGEQREAIAELGTLVSQIEDPVLRRATGDLVARHAGIRTSELVIAGKQAKMREEHLFPYPDELALACARAAIELDALEGDAGEFVREVQRVGVGLAVMRYPAYAHAAASIEADPVDFDALRGDLALRSIGSRIDAAKSWDDITKAAEPLEKFFSEKD